MKVWVLVRAEVSGYESVEKEICGVYADEATAHKVKREREKEPLPRFHRRDDVWFELSEFVVVQ